MLDVKLRSSQVRAARARTASIAAGIVFGIVFGVYLLWRGGDWALNRLIYENDAFAIQEIDVQTDGAIAVDQLRLWAGVRRSQNLFELDLARVKRDLEMVSLVQSVSVERILPHTVRIRVTEREPLAQINVPRPRAGGGLEIAVFQVDADGYVILPLEARQLAPAPGQPPEQFPIICGLNANEIQPGRQLRGPQIQAALQLVRAFEHSPMAALVDLQRIDLSDPEVLLVTTGQGSEITFGLADIDQQLWRWHTIFEAGQHIGKAIASLDLAVSNNIPAHWLEASAVPPANPKPLKPTHPRKKHV